MGHTRDPLAGIPLRDGDWVREGRWWVHPDGSRVPVIAGGTTASFTQSHARIRNDDGNETTATWVAAQDTNAILARDTNYRIRIQVDETAGGTSANFAGVLRYSLNGGAYTAVTGSSSVVRASASSNFTDEAATTNQLTAPTGTFLTGAMDEADGSAGTTQIDFAAGQFTELEYCIQIRSADTNPGDTIDFRVYRSTNALDSYAVTVRALIANVRTMPAGALVVTGLAIFNAASIILGAGSLAIAGQSVGVGFSGPDVGRVAVTGYAPVVDIQAGGGGNVTINVGAGSVAVAGQSVGVGFSGPSVGRLTVQGYAPDVLNGKTITLGVGSLPITGLAPTLQYDVRRDLGLGSLPITGYALTLQYDIRRDIPAGSLPITGYAPSLSGANTITLGVGSTPITGYAPSLTYDIRRDLGAGSTPITGYAPSVNVAGGGLTLFPGRSLEH